MLVALVTSGGSPRRPLHTWRPPRAKRQWAARREEELARPGLPTTPTHEQFHFISFASAALQACLPASVRACRFACSSSPGELQDNAKPRVKVPNYFQPDFSKCSCTYSTFDRHHGSRSYLWKYLQEVAIVRSYLLLPAIKRTLCFAIGLCFAGVSIPIPTICYYWCSEAVHGNHNLKHRL